MHINATRISVVFTAIFTTLSAQNGSISGTVLDASSNDPLIAANITVSSEALTETTGSATDANGQYTIANLPPGEYSVKVNYIGYETKEETITLNSGQSLNLDFKLALSAIEYDTYVVTASRRR